MKKHFTSLNWIMVIVRPYIFSISITVALGALLSLCGIVMAIASKVLIDSASNRNWDSTTYAAIALAATILLQVALQSAFTVLSTRNAEIMADGLRKRLFSRISKAYWLDISKIHSGDIMTRMTGDTNSLSNGLNFIIPNIFSLAVRLIAAFITLLYFEPVLAILAFVLGPVMVLFSRLFLRNLKYQHMKIKESESLYRSYLQEVLGNIPVIKAFRFENRSLEKLDRLQTDKLNWVLRRSRMETAAGSMLSLGYWLGFFLAFGWSAINLSKNAISFGTVAAFIQLVEQIQAPFVELTYTLPQLVSISASATRLMELEKLTPEKYSSELPVINSVGIRFDNVGFSYVRERKVLRDISLAIHPGETIAIVGSSGNGKTTLLRLMLSFISPQKGYVYFTDNFGNTFEACADSRKFIAYVPQGNTLFSGTIEENLLLGKPGATAEELEDVLKKASAWEFIKEQPNGIKTVIGEGGTGLSEGQAQRIALARAFLSTAPVLVLDEATSQLDEETELKVLKAIKDLNPKRTCLIVTHRPAALEICDRVLKLEDEHIKGAMSLK